jgi:hypothetical protein
MTDPNWAPLAPPSAPQPSLDEEERAMKSGRGKMIAFAVVVVLGVLGLVGFLMTSGGTNEYGNIGRQINGMRTGNFDAFWMCALPRANLRNIQNNQQLRDEIHERARFSASQYAQLVRTTCMRDLNDHVQPLDQLIPSDDLRPGIDALRAALRAQIDSWTAYLAYLDTLDGAYDAESDQATSLVSNIARAWFDYKVAHGQLNDIIRTHVTE